MQQIPADVLERFLTVPPIDISVDDEDMGGYVAQIMPTLTSADLGAEIQVKIWEHELSFNDPEYPDLAHDGDFEPGSVEMFVELLTRTRNAFASMMLITTLNVGHSGMAGLSREGDVETLNVAMDSLPDDFFDITLEKAIAARQKYIDDEAAFAGGLKVIKIMNEEAMKRGYTKEQRAQMTIADAFGLDDPKE